MNSLRYLKRLYYNCLYYFLRLKHSFRTNINATEMTLYLHIGMDKTGTSAIQNFMHLNDKRLYESEGILRPVTALWNDYSHHPLAFSILCMHGYTEKDLTNYLSALKKEILTASKVILSSECLFKTTRHENFRQFKTFIDSQFTDVRIIVYVRRQDEWVESRHKHSILSGNELSLEKLSTAHYCDYKQFIDLWRNAFPKAKIIVCPYEKSQFMNGNIFSDFAAQLGITSLHGYKMPLKAVNTSLDNTTAFFKSLCNAIKFTGLAEHKLNGILLDYARQEKGKRKTYPLLSPEKRHALIER